MPKGVIYVVFIDCELQSTAYSALVNICNDYNLNYHSVVKGKRIWGNLEIKELKVKGVVGRRNNSKGTKQQHVDAC